MAPSSAWYQAFEARPAAAVRVYALPCAGGGASMYRPWLPYVPEWVELRAILLPGRQVRHRERAFDNCDAAAHAIAEWLSDEDRPYAIFGHSMGGMLGYLATQILLAEGRTAPLLLGSACWPVQGVAPEVMPANADDDEAFCAQVSRMGGPVAELLVDDEFRPMVLPVLRADFALCHSYGYRDEPPMPVPIAVYGGESDPVTPPEKLDEWNNRSAHIRGPRLFRGGHFFFQDDPAELTAAIFTDLSWALERSELASDRS